MYQKGKAWSCKRSTGNKKNHSFVYSENSIKLLRSYIQKEFKGYIGILLFDQRQYNRANGLKGEIRKKAQHEIETEDLFPNI